MTGYGEEVAGGHDGRVLVRDPVEPGTPLVELGRHENWVEAVAVLPDGRYAQRDRTRLNPRQRQGNAIHQQARVPPRSGVEWRARPASSFSSSRIRSFVGRHDVQQGGRAVKPRGRGGQRTR